MTDLVLTKVTQKGQMTIPQELRHMLGVEPGDFVTLRPLMGGLFLAKASVSSQVEATDVLRRLVVTLGKEAESRGIRDDTDLDAVIEDIQQRVYQESYGG